MKQLSNLSAALVSHERAFIKNLKIRFYGRNIRKIDTFGSFLISFPVLLTIKKTTVFNTLNISQGWFVMFEVLCYGDSNTWGADPNRAGRFSRESRWPGVLQSALGDEYHIIEEGLGGRTTVWEDPIEGYKNGKEYLIPCLATHSPLDLVIILLGTNDLKKRFSVSAQDIAFGAGVLVDTVYKSGSGRNGRPPKVLLLAPPPLGKLTELQEMFEGGQEKSQKFSEHFRAIAKTYGCEFFDTATVIESSDLDGIHFEKATHKKLGEALVNRVKTILN
jgi:lysophospholipase L1-like esterase